MTIATTKTASANRRAILTELKAIARQHLHGSLTWPAIEAKHHPFLELAFAGGLMRRDSRSPLGFAPTAIGRSPRVMLYAALAGHLQSSQMVSELYRAGLIDVDAAEQLGDSFAIEDFKSRDFGV